LDIPFSCCPMLFRAGGVEEWRCPRPSGGTDARTGVEVGTGVRERQCTAVDGYVVEVVSLRQHVLCVRAPGGGLPGPRHPLK